MDVAAVAKIVVGGSPGAGTTTFVRAASEIEPLDCDVAAAPAARRGGVRTMGFDFGRLTVPPGLAVRLFGRPGGRGADFLWDVAAAGACGAVVVLDGRNPAAGTGLAEKVRRLGVPWLVAVNRRAPGAFPGPGEVSRLLGCGVGVPVVSCDVRSRESARAVLNVLLASLRTRLEARAAQRPCRVAT